MARLAFKAMPLLLALVLAGAGTALAQDDGDITGMLIKSYDLLEAGKLAQAQEIYQQVLKKDPDNPLALNNLGAIKVKEKQYDQALAFMEQARRRAKDYQVMVNQVCDVEGLCMAFRPAQKVYGNRELTPLIQLNMELIKAKLAGEKK